MTWCFLCSRMFCLPVPGQTHTVSLSLFLEFFFISHSCFYFILWFHLRNNYTTGNVHFSVSQLPEVSPTVIYWFEYFRVIGDVSLHFKHHEACDYYTFLLEINMLKQKENTTGRLCFFEWIMEWKSWAGDMKGKRKQMLGPELERHSLQPSFKWW